MYHDKIFIIEHFLFPKNSNFQFPLFLSLAISKDEHDE